MKNLLIVAIAIIISTTLFSCKKSYTCTCQSVWDQKWHDTKVKAYTRNKAQKECRDRVSYWVDGPTNCKLKNWYEL